MSRETSVKSEEVTIPQNPEEAEALLTKLGQAHRAVITIDTKLNQQAANMLKKAKEEAAPHLATIDEIYNALQAFAGAHRRDLTEDGKRKFVDVPSGRLGWRDQKPRIVLTEKDSEVLPNLESVGIHDCVRVKREVDKTKLLKRLIDLGMSGEIRGVRIIGRGETFYVKLVKLGVEFPLKKKLTPEIKKATAKQ